MWLIDTTALTLKNLNQCPSETYAILSHTWGSSDDEISFDEFRAGEGRQKPGFRKIRLCCEQAQKDGLKYAWVDTCCIDKRSSAELSEAINSMFSWYQCAKLCYVYLSDVHDHDSIAPEESPAEFLNSRWFTRGWTLQELIAPQTVIFYTYEWTCIGDRASLAQPVHAITRIAPEVLMASESFRNYSVAQRMSWASTRQTTRVEDMAYCLFGLFNVNMSLLYGEGQEAFKRLQKEIIQQTVDESIFAWNGTGQDSGLLASDPAQFIDSGDIRTKREHEYNPPLMTPLGLSVECRMLPLELNVYLVLLQCEKGVPGSGAKQVGLAVCRTSDDLQYRRVAHHGKWLIDATRQDPSKAVKSTIFVHELAAFRPTEHTGLPLVHIESTLHACRVWNPHIFPKDSFTETTRLEFSSQDLDEGCIIALKRSTEPSSHFRYHFELGFDRDFTPVCIFYPKGFRKHTTSFRIVKDPGNFWSNTRHKGSFSQDPGGPTDSTTMEKVLDIGERSFEAHLGLRSRLNSYAYSIAHPVRGDRMTGFRLSTSIFSYQAAKCVQVMVNFEPLQGSNWRLTVKEKPLHPTGHHVRLCFACFFHHLGPVPWVSSFLSSKYEILAFLRDLFRLVAYIAWAIFVAYNLNIWLDLSVWGSFVLSACMVLTPLFLQSLRS